MTAGEHALAEPHGRVHGHWIAGFAVAWFGIWMAQLAPYQLLLPQQVEASTATGDWTTAVSNFGTVSGVAGVVTFFAYPLVGALSDRTTGRWGRRRPWIVGGAVLFGAGLAVLGGQHSFAGLVVWWSVAMVGFCAVTAGLTALIADRVPVAQRGTVSAWISAPQALGVIVGLLLVTELVTDPGVGYALLGVILLLTMAPIVLRTPEVALAAADRPALSAGAIVRGVWISPRRQPDFAWTLLGRVLVNIGNALGTGLLFYFLEFGLGVDDPDGLLLQVTLVYLVAVVAAALVSGARSDRSLRRKPYVVVSSALIAVAGLLLALTPSVPTTYLGAGLLGLGYGAFLAVDQALATQVLPDAANRGKDLGIMNIATAVPQALAPLGGAALVSLTQGFTALFLVSGIAAVLGALCMIPIRSVR